MNYKKIVKSRELRRKILRFFSFVPDKQMITLQYRLKTGRRLNLKNPKRFTEKLQWYKLYYKNPQMVRCVDKYDVRDYVRSKGLEEILIPCYGIYNNFEDINWDVLPEQFVIKDTLGGGGTSVIIVKNKKNENLVGLREKISEWTSIKAHEKCDGREWPYYSGKKHRIIIEKYIEPSIDSDGLIEYKFFCFNGKTKWIYVLADREMGKGVGVGIFDEYFNMQSVERVDEKPLKRTIQKPDNFETMKKIAAILSMDFPEARIDLYNVDGNIKFGEITFFDGSGYMKFNPDKFDYILGKEFDIRGLK